MCILVRERMPAKINEVEGLALTTTDTQLHGGLSHLWVQSTCNDLQ